MRSSFKIWGYVRHFFLRVTRALGTFCGSRTSSISNPPSSECGGIPSSPYIGVRACVCARSCAYLCAGKKEKKWRWRRFRRKRSFTRACRGGSYANNLYRIFVFVYLLLFTFFIPLSLILSSAFHMYLFTFYGSFCSIPRQLLLRRGFVTINLLVFLFTE